MSDDYISIIEGLKKIKNEEELSRSNDVIQRTISSLISVEKQALYGSLRGKQKKIEEIILNELKNYSGSD
ncbi:MAG: hypothetical protein ACU88J_04235 [Gammaproteobacteria bacterium]